MSKLGIYCPACGSDEDCGVKDSRPTDRGSIRRRRFCGSCGHRFTAYEMPATEIERMQENSDKFEYITASNPFAEAITRARHMTFEQVLLRISKSFGSNA